MGTNVALILGRRHHVAQLDLTPSFAARERTVADLPHDRRQKVSLLLKKLLVIEGGLGFHTKRYPLAYSDRLFSSFRASTSEPETHRPSMWTHTPATPSPSRSSSTSADFGYLSQYDTDSNAHLTRQS
jgi:hypothetical protein